MPHQFDTALRAAIAAHQQPTAPKIMVVQVDGFQLPFKDDGSMAIIHIAFRARRGDTLAAEFLNAIELRLPEIGDNLQLTGRMYWPMEQQAQDEKAADSTPNTPQSMDGLVFDQVGHQWVRPKNSIDEV